MLRKISLALIAATSLGAAALIPGTASAHGWHHGWGHHGLWGGSALYIGGVTDGCYQRRLIDTPRGPRWRTIYVCSY